MLEDPDRLRSPAICSDSEQDVIASICRSCCRSSGGGAFDVPSAFTFSPSTRGKALELLSKVVVGADMISFDMLGGGPRGAGNGDQELSCSEDAAASFQS